MHDLTKGPISGHLLRLAAPMAAGMIFQTMYFLVDLFFVARLGDTAVAGVSAAGNIQFIVMSLTQILAVGTMVLVSHAAGRKDRADANLIYNQSLFISVFCAGLTLVVGLAAARVYIGTVAASQAAFEAGTSYLRWFVPGLALQFVAAAMGAALRGTGIAKPTMVVQVFSVAMNAALAPVLIAGWLTGRPMGVAGAGLATSISVASGTLLMFLYFERLEHFVRFDKSLFRPRPSEWWRVLRIGLPAGGEFALMFVYMGVIYWCIRGFGTEAQAGFGIGSRINQAIFLPAMAVAFAAAPVAGQNFGAGMHARTRETFKVAAVIGGALMLLLTVVCQIEAPALVSIFTTAPAVVEVSTGFLRIVSWNFVASGILFTASSMFQAMGNTVPSVLASASRLLTFAPPAIWLSTRPGFRIVHIWTLGVATVALQLVISLLLLRREFRSRLSSAIPAQTAPR